jgi:hypothetical protein
MVGKGLEGDNAEECPFSHIEARQNYKALLTLLGFTRLMLPTMAVAQRQLMRRLSSGR